MTKLLFLITIFLFNSAMGSNQLSIDDSLAERIYLTAIKKQFSEKYVTDTLSIQKLYSEILDKVSNIFESVNEYADKNMSKIDNRAYIISSDKVIFETRTNRYECDGQIAKRNNYGSNEFAVKLYRCKKQSYQTGEMIELPCTENHCGAIIHGLISLPRA